MTGIRFFSSYWNKSFVEIKTNHIKLNRKEEIPWLQLCLNCYIFLDISFSVHTLFSDTSFADMFGRLIDDYIWLSTLYFTFLKEFLNFQECTNFKQQQTIYLSLYMSYFKPHRPWYWHLGKPLIYCAIVRNTLSNTNTPCSRNLFHLKT